MAVRRVEVVFVLDTRGFAYWIEVDVDRASLTGARGGG